MKSIFVLDDHKLFSGGLTLILRTLSPEIECRCFEESAELSAALDQTNSPPDLFVIDLYVPGSDVPSLVRELRERFPATKIMIVSASINSADRDQAMKAGASMFLNKDSEPATLIEAVESLLQGHVPTNRPIAARSLAEKYKLTPRQLESLVLASKGLSNKEIARILNVSPETVKSHMSEIFQRFDVSNRVEAIDFARSRGLS